ncbi:unnamed protein product [Rangifer tarandus platyrhynchus]|uniref:Uncharacterized protein n=2 Tax=Rangifer tarandus platyrhynchus TaxID=3082113 RepID=A0ACB0DQ00_RANTA|nr:unnamed protein product [Rangifer tarandus platyrhynchus]CAI9690313.1 unnamed protein product [Rangifer tarandus platyrhynchus]
MRAEPFKEVKPHGKLPETSGKEKEMSASELHRSIYSDGPALIPPAVCRAGRYVFLVSSTDEDELHLNAPGGLFTPRSDSEGEIVNFGLM